MKENRSVEISALLFFCLGILYIQYIFYDYDEAAGFIKKLKNAVDKQILQWYYETPPRKTVEQFFGFSQIFSKKDLKKNKKTVDS